MSARKNLKVKNKLDLNELIGYFENITTGLKSGTLSFQQGKDLVEIQPSEKMSLVINAEDKKDKSYLTIELIIKKDEKKDELKITAQNNSVNNKENTGKIKAA